METVTGNDIDSQDEEKENENGEVDVFGSQMSLNSSTHENEACTNLENGVSDRFGAVRTINNTVERKQRSREFKTTTYSDVRLGRTRITGPGFKLLDLKAD